MATEILRPNADGVDTAWTASAGADWECVDEAVADDNTTYIEVASLTVADADELVALQDSAIGVGDTINSVTLTLRMRRLVGGTDPSYNIIWRDNGVKTITVTAALSSTSFVDITETLTLRPSDDAPWTLTDLNDLQVGLARVGNVATGGIRCTQIFVTVDYTVAGSHRRRTLDLMGLG